MSRNRRDFDRGIANAFLVGFHEERTEEDPPESREPHIVSNVIR